jgi:hypothetical protein
LRRYIMADAQDILDVTIDYVLEIGATRYLPATSSKLIMNPRF